MLAKKKTAKNSSETFVYYVGIGFRIPWHFCKGYDLFFLTVETTCSTNLYCVLITLERVKQKTIFLSLITLFWFLRVPLL